MKEKKYPLIGRERFEEYQGNLKTSSFDIAGTTIGTEKPLIIAGPCTVHSRQQTLESAHGVNIPANSMRNTPRPEFLAELRRATFLPVIGDPSHSAGDRELVPQVGKDYLNAGANGLIIDILGDHEKPVTDDGVEVCDYQQGLRMSEFKKYLESLQNHRVPQ